MNGAQLRVVKIGGSLLDMPDLVERLRSWSDQQLELGPLWFLVGGGTMVEQIRIDHQHGHFTESAAHWASIAVMCENTAELAQRFQGSRRLRVSGNLRRVTYPAAADTSRIQDDDRIEFVDVEPFLRGQATDPKVPPPALLLGRHQRFDCRFDRRWAWSRRVRPSQVATSGRWSRGQRTGERWLRRPLFSKRCCALAANSLCRFPVGRFFRGALEKRQHS